MRARLAIFGLLFGLQLGLADAAFAATKVLVSQAGVQLYRMPIYVALLNGYFKDEGLDVELVTTRSGADSIKMMVGGAVQFANGPPVDLVNLRNQDIDAKCIAMLSMRLNNSIIVRKEKANEIKSFVDLKGRSLGISGVGSGTWQIVQAMARITGIDPDSINLVSLGVGGSIASAFQAGRVDAISYVDPENYQLMASGEAVPLVDLADDATHRKYFGDELLFNDVAVMSDYAKKNPQTVQAFANAVQRAVSWMHGQPAAAIAKLMKTYEPFQGVEEGLLTATVSRAMIGVPKSIETTTVAFDKMNDLLIKIKIVDTPVSFPLAVDNTFAAAAAKKYPVGH